MLSPTCVLPEIIPPAAFFFAFDTAPAIIPITLNTAATDAIIAAILAGNGKLDALEAALENPEDQEYSIDKPSDAGFYVVKAAIGETTNYEAIDLYTGLIIYQKTVQLEWDEESLIFSTCNGHRNDRLCAKEQRTLQD